MSRIVALLCFIGLLPLSAGAFDTVVIDPGHGGSDPGAVRGSIKEKHLALDVSQRLEGCLRYNGIRTIMTRRSDSTLSLSARAKIANRYPRAIFVSIHFNASKRRSASGMETFYMSDKGKRLAASVQRSLDNRVPGKDRGWNEENFKVLRATQGTAILVECGFISNPSEAQNCASWAHRQKVASAIARGLVAMRHSL
jgi:N-acetylmuramoyl-L-alanine amidase